MVAAPQRSAGEGRISVRRVNGRVAINTLFQEGCAKIRWPKGRANEAFEAVLINTAGGLTGGDRLAWTIGVGTDCRVQATTQACEKIYKAAEGTARVSTEIDVAEGAFLSWLPQETILFDRSSLTRTLDVRLGGNARALIAEAVVFGRQAMGETVVTGTFSDRWRIWREGRLVHAEDFRIGPDVAEMINRPALLGGARAMATVLFAGDAERHLERARAIIGEKGGASVWSGKFLARLYDEDAYHLRKRLVPLVELLNEKARLPKVWSI